MTDHEGIQVVLHGMHEGKITPQEADAFLRAKHGMTLGHAERVIHTPDERKSHGRRRRAIQGLTTLLVLLFLGIGFYMVSETPAGLVSYDVPVTDQNTTYVINETLTSLRASGILTGEGSATLHFVTKTGTLLIGTVASDSGDPRTAQPSYLAGEPVTLEHAPLNASYYLDDGAQNIPVSVPFFAPEQNATLLIVANENSIVTTYRVPILIGDFPRTTMFTDLCIETCTLENTTGFVEIITEGEALVTVNLTGREPVANRAPELVADIPNQTLESAIVIDLNSYFTDPDGDSLLFSTSLNTLVGTSVNGSFLTLTPRDAGTETVRIYASDLKELVDTTFEVTVPSTPLVNRTGNTTQENTTASTNVSEPSIEPVGIDCSDPDVNRRPVDCLTMEAETYFEEDVFWEDVGRQKVARITALGNLLIPGRVFQHANIEAQSGDFVISYKDENFNTVPTVWIDSDGNLHLKGTLHEENTQLYPTSGSYATINRRGVYLVYANRQTGDLFLRGNVIPFREDITR